MALVGLILLSPVLLAVAVLVRWWLGAPVLFRQPRPGTEARKFEILKFRTMRDATDAHGQPLSDDQRLTRLGQFLRSTSLDELPELWNVLKGEMSLVGPRPLLMEYLPLYNDRQRRRHEVRPGITGWAQVNGRNAIEWDDKLEMDVWYVENQSLWLDLKILAMTFWKVLRRSDISEEGHATKQKFRGSVAAEDRSHKVH